jgi:hypothetical protein
MSDNKKENQKKYLKKYYTDNKTKILAGMCEKIPCSECGKLISKCNMNKHKATYVCQRKTGVKKDDDDDKVAKLTEMVQRLLDKQEIRD